MHQTRTKTFGNQLKSLLSELSEPATNNSQSTSTMNSQPQGMGMRKAPFIYPEYLSQMTSKIKPSRKQEETTQQQSPLFPSMKDFPLPAQGLGDTTNIDDLKQTPSTSTSTTSDTNTTASAMPAPRTQYSSGMTAASDPLPSQPLMYSSISPMNRGMFMNQRMPNFNMSSAFSGGFSNLFSRKPIIPEHEPSPPPDEGKDDQSITSTTSSTRRTLFPETPIMLIPTSSKQGASTPKRSRSSSFNSRSPPKRAVPVSPKLQPTISPLPPPQQSPFRNIGKTLRMTSAGTVVGGTSNHSTSSATASRNAIEAPTTINTSSNVSVASTTSNLSTTRVGDVSVASTTSGFSTSSARFQKEPPKIRVKHIRGKSPKRKACVNCVCRDQKLVDQRKEIDHLKEVIQDLLVMSMETKKDWDDDSSLEDLPMPEILHERAPHQGDLTKAAEMALNPSRQAYEVDPSDPLRTHAVSSTSSMLQMSHSLQVKQAFKRGSPSASSDVRKIRHLRIQVNGNWGYYSGPKPSEDTQLVGCVVRFDNGDLYLGNMENSCFHGPGTYYPKGGKAFRGSFVWNQLDTADYDEDDDYSC